jgi:hypothetical protein
MDHFTVPGSLIASTYFCWGMCVYEHTCMLDDVGNVILDFYT